MYFGVRSNYLLNMKRCAKCKQEKSLDNFNKRAGTKDGLTHHCKECSRYLTRQSYWKNPKYYRKRVSECRKKIAYFIKNIKEITPCKDCGKSYPYYCMDFDHMDGSIKKFNVARGRNEGFNKVKLEINKCEVVCCMCHRIRTHNRKIKRLCNEIG